MKSRNKDPQLRKRLAMDRRRLLPVTRYIPRIKRKPQTVFPIAVSGYTYMYRRILQTRDYAVWDIPF